MPAIVLLYYCEHILGGVQAAARFLQMICDDGFKAGPLLFFVNLRDHQS